MTKFLRCAVFLALIFSTFLLFSCGGGAEDSNSDASEDSSLESEGGSGTDKGDNNNESDNGTSEDNGSEDDSEEYVPAPYGTASFDDIDLGTRIGADIVTTNGARFSFDEKCDGTVTVVKSPFGKGQAL